MTSFTPSAERVPEYGRFTLIARRNGFEEMDTEARSMLGDEPRRLTPLLLLGILVLPVIFVWFLLRRGYSNTLRGGAFAYMAVTLALGVVQAFGTGL